MQNVALSHQAQTKEHLLGISPNSPEVDTNIASEFLQNFTEVDTKILKDHAQVSLVFEIPL